jgi:mRNA interferase HigB
MRVISFKKLREFWEHPHTPDAESALRTWYQTVRAADWTCFADVRQTYRTADVVGNKIVFDIGGNKYRLIAVIDYEGHKVFIRHVLAHKDYDKGLWRKDTFGEDWKPRPRRRDVTQQERLTEEPQAGSGRRRRRGRRRP